MHWFLFGVRRAYADQLFEIFWHTPKTLRLIRLFFYSFQLKEVKEANWNAIMNALKFPEANIQQLIKEMEEKYKSGYIHVNIMVSDL